MMPVGAPTNSFSARLAIAASARRGTDTARKRAQRQGHRALERGGRRHARAYRQVGVDVERRAAHRVPGGAQRPRHARRVGRPAGHRAGRERVQVGRSPGRLAPAWTAARAGRRPARSRSRSRPGQARRAARSPRCSRCAHPSGWRAPERTRLPPPRYPCCLRACLSTPRDRYRIRTLFFFGRSPLDVGGQGTTKNNEVLYTVASKRAWDISTS